MKDIRKDLWPFSFKALWFVVVAFVVVFNGCLLWVLILGIRWLSRQ
jgi:hypothetical protein